MTADALQAATSRRRRSRLRVRHWRVRTKLGAVLVIPLAGFLLLAGTQIAASVRTASELDDFSERVALGQQVTDLVHELQRERDRTAEVLASLPGSPGASPPPHDLVALAPEWREVDAAAERLRAEATQLLDDDVLASAYRRAEAQLDELHRVREGARHGWLRTQAVFGAYSQVITRLLELLPLPADVGGDVALGGVVRSVAELAMAKELTAQIRGEILVVCHTGRFSSGGFERVTAIRAEQRQALDRFRNAADQRQLARWDDVVTGQAVRNADRLRQTVIGNATDRATEVDPLQWWSASTTELELMRTVERTLLESAAQQVAAASRSRWIATALGSLATTGLLGVALLLSVLIGRTMAATLRSLRVQAMHVAQHQLPSVIDELRRAPAAAPVMEVQAVVVDSRDEIGEVAEAFTAVQHSAVRLATEQAHMRRNANEIFTKLALRSQTLVERQLRLLDTMESTEIDPDQLANLFRLDHLATRLRRNDENLMVLAGAETSRRWTRPVDLSTIVLAAAAEIEHYPRIRNDVTEAVHVVGFVVADLINLLAELLENATVFSPPDTAVIVRGDAVDDGSAELVISDCGIGMSPEALAEANLQVRTPSSIDVSAAERMGLVVVGHLASRHGISVELNSREQGVTVYVGIPATLITSAPDEETSEEEPAGPVGRPRPTAPDPTPTATAAADVEPRLAPTRAEDVLRPGRRSPSVWWSKAPGTDRDAPLPARASPPPTDSPEASTDTPEVTDAGLPVRRRMSHLPVGAEPQPVSETAEVDPDAVGDMLTRLYSGLRRADTESGTSGTSR